MAGALRRARTHACGAPPARLLDLACGACDATASLPGEVTGRGADASTPAVASRRLPHARLVRGDAPALRFRSVLERARATRFDGHVEPGERQRFPIEAHRVAPDAVVYEPAQRADVEPDERQERICDDGARASP